MRHGGDRGLGTRPVEVYLPDKSCTSLPGPSRSRCHSVPVKGGLPLSRDVQDDPQAPQVTALVIEGGLIGEHLHHLGGHVLSRTTLERREKGE